MPLPTLQAAAGDGEVTGATADDDPTPDLDALRAAGIDLDDVTDQLLRDGIDAFVVPMNKLLAGIEAKREAIVTGRPTSFEADLPPELEQPVAERLRKAARGGRRAPHLAHGRHALGAGRHAGARGPARLADDRRQAARGPRRRSRTSSPRCATDGITDVVLLGMGGSSLAPEVFRRSSPPGRGRAAPARARLDRAARGAGGRRRDRRRDDAVHRLLEVGRDDRAERAARLLPRPAARPGALRRDHRPRHVDARAGRRARASATSSCPTPRSAGATRRCRRSASCRPRWPASTSRPCSRARQVAAENCELPEGNSGLWLGAALGELALRGRDKLTFVVDPPLGSFGLWAEQLVAESTGKQGRGILPIADEPLADAVAPTATTACSCTCATPTRPTRATPRRSRRSPRPATRRSRVTADGRERPRPDLLLLRVRHRGRRLGAGDQPVRPAQRAGGQGQHRQGARGGHAGGPARTARSPSCSTAWRRPAYLAIMGYLPYDDAIDAAVAELRAALIERSRRRDHVGLRPALPALDRPVPQGRAADRALPPARARRGATTSPVPGKPYTFRTLIDAQADGDLQTLRDARPPGRPRAPARRRPRRRHHPTPGSSSSMQLGFVGLGKMGGNMVHRIHRDSDHEVVAFDYNEAAVERRRGARRDRRALARGPRRRARDAADRLADGAVGRPDGADDRGARRAARAGRHDRRRRQHEVARRRAPRRRARRARASTTSTSARPAACGASRSATA